jgi:hypothetical protein
MGMPRATAAVASALLLAACGGRDAPRGPQPRGAPTEPPDPAAMRALLATYSPSGHAIVTTFESLPESFTLVDGGPWKVPKGEGFDSYLRDGAVENVAKYLSTAVHEITHGYTGQMGFQLLVDRGLPYGEGAQAILADGDPWLVPYTARFPSLEMDATFPADARPSRYDGYIGPDAPANLGTQVHGVYGLVDEYAAYYQGARTLVDLWPWVRDVAPADPWLAVNYAVDLDAEVAAYADFTLYILHYLVHARDHQPAVYEGVTANDGFRQAFIDVHDAYAALVVTMEELEPAAHAFAATRGVDLARRDDGALMIGSSPQQLDEVAPRRAARAYLDQEPYRSMLETIRR